MKIKHFATTLAAMGALFLLGLILPKTVSYAQETTAVPGEAIVVYQKKDSVTTLKKLAKSDDSISLEGNITLGNLTTSCVSSEDKSTKELVHYLESQPGVAYVEPNYYIKATSLDNYYPYQWGLNNLGQWGGVSGSDIQADVMWDSGYTGNNTVVAIIDSGVDYTHEDLAANMWHNTTSLPGGCGYDFMGNDNNPMDDNEDGHGTHCAGTIAAVGNNGAGITGVSPGSKIMALKALNSRGEGNVWTVIQCYKYIYSAMEAGVNVVAVNNSWGEASPSATLDDLVTKVGKKGAVSVFASGNDGKVITTNDIPVYKSNPYAIIVGATESDGTLADYSNYGSTAVDLCAPGTDILSTVNYDQFLPMAYTDAQRAALCQFWTGFDHETDIFPFVAKSTTLHPTLSWDATASVPDSSQKGCMKIKVTNPSYLKQSLNLYYVMNADGGDHTITTNVGIDSPHDWIMKTFTSDTFEEIDGQTCLGICTLTIPAGTTRTYYLDTFAISLTNAVTASFGKYDIASGTSMAAPFVSGGIALLAQSAPGWSGDKLRSYALRCVRTLPALAGKVSTAGTLDLSTYAAAKAATQTEYNNIKTKIPVKKLKVKYPKKITAGMKYKIRATILPSNATNKKVSYKVNHKKYATISSKGTLVAKKKGRGKKIKVTVTSKSNSKLKVNVTIRIRR